MQSAGVSFGLTRSTWTTFHTYLPYYDPYKDKVKTYYQKLQCKITKYKDVLNTATGNSRNSRTSQDTEPTRTLTITMNVQIPTSNANNLASGITSKDFFNRGTREDDVLSYLATMGEDITGFFNIVVVDYKTGENLLTVETSASNSNEGENYQGVKTTLTKWMPVSSGSDKDQRMHTTAMGNTYYEEYYAVLTVTAPASYSRLCIGISGIKKSVAKQGAKYIESYNMGYTLGYGSYPDSAYSVKNDKLISTFMRIKKKKVPVNTNTKTR